MNPNDTELFDWRQRRDTEPRQQWTSAGQKIKLIQMSDSDPYSCSGGSPRESLTSRGRTNGEWEQHNPSSQRSYSVNSEAFTQSRCSDPDGEPLPLSNEDQELARKRKQLELIEKQILIKKATIAIKTIEPLFQAKSAHQTFDEEREEDISDRKADVTVENNEHVRALIQEKKGDPFYSMHSIKNGDIYPNKGRPLKDRVNIILQKRRPDDFYRKLHSPVPNLAKSLPHQPKVANKHGLPLDDHPLKRRVMALMSYRRTRTYLSQSDGEVPDVKPPLESASPTNLEQDTIAKGFQRFLSVLNKGVDINLLTKIVNDDSEAPDVLREPPVSSDLENESDALDTEDSQGSHSKALQRGRSRSSSLEQKKKLSDQKEDQAETHRLSLVNEKSIQENDGGGRRSRSKSPTPVEKEIKPEQQQQHDQLQYLLTTLGLSLDAEELSRLTKRTQERLYGKKEDNKKGSTSEKDKLQKGPQKPKTRLTFSLSSLSSTPPTQKCSPTQAPLESVHTSETSSLRERKVRKTRWDRDSQTDVNETCRDREGMNQSLNTELAKRSQDRGAQWSHEAGQAENGQIVIGNEKSLNTDRAERCEDLANVGINSWETSLCHPSYTENPPHAFPQPESEPVMPVYHNAQYYQFTAYSTCTSNDAMSLPWVYPSDSQVPPTPFLPGNHPQNFRSPVDLSGQIYPYSQPAGPLQLENAHLMLQVDQNRQQTDPGYQQNQKSYFTGRLAHCQEKTAKKKGKKKKKSEAKCSAVKDSVGSDKPVKTTQRKQNNTAKISALPNKPVNMTQQKQKNKGRVSVGPDEPVKAQQSEEVKQQPKKEQATLSTVEPVIKTPQSEVKQQLTEEEIKANFKKKLNMFNQKMKQKTVKPNELPAVGYSAYWENKNGNNKNEGQCNVYTELPDHIFNFETASSSSQP